MLVLLLTAALSAQADTAFVVNAPSPQVISWLRANRDAMVTYGGAAVMERGGLRGEYLRVSRDGVSLWLFESAEVQPDRAIYRAKLFGTHRKIRSWDMTAQVYPTVGGTAIVIHVSATVYGLGDPVVERKARDALAGVRSALQAQFR